MKTLSVETTEKIHEAIYNILLDEVLDGVAGDCISYVNIGRSPLHDACEHFKLDIEKLKEYYKQQQGMKTKFRIKLDTEFEVDFSDINLSDSQQNKESELKKLILKEYIGFAGYDEFEINEVKETSLFEVMGEMFRPI